MRARFYIENSGSYPINHFPPNIKHPQKPWLSRGFPHNWYHRGVLNLNEQGMGLITVLAIYGI
jgi:hypothetical protein